MPPQPCPHCGKEINSTGPADRGPAPPPTSGSFVLCFGCAELLVWQDGPFGLALRVPTPDEQAEFREHHQHHQDKLRLFHAVYGQPGDG